MATISEVLRAKAVQVRTEVRQDDPRQSAVRRTRRLETFFRKLMEFGLYKFKFSISLQTSKSGFIICSNSSDEFPKLEKASYHFVSFIF